MASAAPWTAWLDELPEGSIEDAARLLSAHWSRSIASRVASLRTPSGAGQGAGGSHSRLPRSLVVCMPAAEQSDADCVGTQQPALRRTENSGAFSCGRAPQPGAVDVSPGVACPARERPRLIGHARLKSFREGGDTSVLVESVLVEASARGSGLGRLLMESVEEHARELGMTRIVLSTSDKQVRSRARDMVHAHDF
jgi:GNAT superfamily N-acetyltransferase